MTKDGACNFKINVYRSENYNRYIDQKYFTEVGMVARFPRYVNKRSLDPVVKVFMDKNNIEKPEGWDLPTPNPEAAYISLSKYAKEIKYMDSQQVEDMNLAWAWLSRQFGPYMMESKVRGVDEVIDDLDLTTSSGYPFNTLFKTKKELFENRRDEMREWLLCDWDEMLTNEYYTYIATNSLKEELRLEEKIKINSIRTFTAMPTDATVQGNRLFADMNEKMNEAYLVTASAVGMSPFGGNWERMYQKLNKFKKGYALDESQYDSSLRAYLMWGCAEFRFSMLRQEDRTPENKKRIQVYYRNLVNTLIITPEGVLIMKKTGNPSGSCNTVNDNTIILYVLLAYAWIRTCPQDQCGYEEFENNTAKMLLGDDNTWTVSDEAHKFYNARSIIAEWNKIGVTTTTDSLEPRLPEQLDFLSAKTVFMQGKAVPLYERSKLLTSLLYAPKFERDPAVTLERATALMLNGWTDIPFRNFCREFISWLLCQFDKTLFDYPEWISAKAGILSDQRYFQIFVGTASFDLEPQSHDYSESTRKIIKPNKSLMNEANKQRKRGTRREKRKRNNNNNRKGQPFIGDVIMMSPQQLRQNQNGKRKRKPRNRKGQGMELAQKKRGMTYVPSSMDFDGDELIATVNGTVAFTSTTYPLNPGNSTTFPFASRTAQNFDKYEVMFLEVYYKPSQGVFSAQGVGGMCGISVTADAKQTPPSTKVQAEVYPIKTLGIVNKDMIVKVPKKFLQSATNQKHFVRSGQLPGGADINSYDCGQIFFWTSGEAGATEIGELRIRYKIKLINPVLEPSTTAPTNFSCSWFVSNGSESCNTGVSKTLALATAQVNGLGAVNTAGSIVLPVGNYMLDGFIIISDSTAEVFNSDTTLRKNAAGIFTSLSTMTLNPQTEIAIATGAACRYTIPVSCFYSSNGSDALTWTVTLTGAAGTLAAEASLRIVAI